MILLHYSYTLVAEGKDCQATENEFKKKTSLEVCAITCKSSSTMFVYGFKEERCSSSSLNLCDCYCITGAEKDGFCTTYDNQFYKLYKYQDLEEPERRGMLLVYASLRLFKLNASSSIMNK